MPIVHVNSHKIRAKDPTPISVRNTRSAPAVPAGEVDILDRNGDVVATVMYSPDRPLSCGARVWIEADWVVAR